MQNQRDKSMFYLFRHFTDMKSHETISWNMVVLYIVAR